MTRAEKYRAEAERVRQAYQDHLSKGDELLVGKDTVTEAVQAEADEHYANAKVAHAKVDEWLNRAKLADADDERGRMLDASRERNALPQVEAAAGVERESDLNIAPTPKQLFSRRVQLGLMASGEAYDKHVALERWPVEGLFPKAIHGVFQYGDATRKMTAAEAKAWKDYQAMANIVDRAEFAITPTQKSDDDALGGVLVPDYLDAQIRAAAQPQGALADDRLITVIVQGSNGTRKLPRFTDINQRNPVRIVEAADVSPEAAATDEVQLDPENFAIQMALPDQMLFSDVLNIEDFLSRRIGMNFGRQQNAFFTNGTGVNQPKGVTRIASGRHTATANQTALALADITGLLKAGADNGFHGRDTTYAMAHQSTIFDLLELRDNGQLVFTRTPDQLNVVLANGARVLQNNALSVVGASTTGLDIMVVGDLADYTKVQVAGFRFERQRELQSYQWRIAWNTYYDGSPVVEENWNLLKTS